MDVSPAGIGHRIYEVRSALGPDARHELPQRAFAEILNAKAAELISDEGERPVYDSSVIARLETGKRRASVYDLTVIAAVDPACRGKLWLVWNERVDSALPAPQTLEEIAAATGATIGKPRTLSLKDLEREVDEKQKAASKGGRRRA